MGTSNFPSILHVSAIHPPLTYIFISCVLTGNAELPAAQHVLYYIVSVGSDRRYPNTRNDIVPATFVGTNTSVVFEHLDLTVNGLYFVTVQATSNSSSRATVTSNGMTVGVGNTVERKST